MIMISSNVIFNFIDSCVIVSFLIKLLTLGILFSTTVRAEVVAKLVILGILALTSIMFSLEAVVAPKLVILSISSLNSFILRLGVVSVAKLVISDPLSSIF